MGREDEDIDRGTWSGKLDFLLSAIGYAVGIGNVWRFPYMTYKNGGASFLFPYLIMLVIAGLPLFCLELSVGQFSSQGPITCWQMAPFFTGIGYGMVCISAVVSIYYNMIITYAVYYMLVSFVHLGEDLPWESCDNDWNEPQCREDALPDLNDYSNATERKEVLYRDLFNEVCVKNKTILANWDTADKYNDFWNAFNIQYNYSTTPTFDQITAYEVDGYGGFSDCKITYVSPAEEFYRFNMLDEKDNEDLEDIGDISVKLALTLLAAWILIFACMLKGIKTSGKVVYFTATFPYIVLVVLMIRGVTLTGAWDGLEFYLVPEWDKLTDATIWGDAASQIFYSLGVGFGGLLTMASYNKFNNNCKRDAILVSFINCGTSIFAGFAIFSMLGHMAHATNQDVEDVAKGGTGLAFIAYPDGISQLPGSAVWAFLFFFMLLTLGMDSQFAMMETIISAISDIYPNFLRKHKTAFTFILCIVGYLLGLPLCTEGGGRVLSLMDNYSGSYNLMVIALAECICLCYVYGIGRFREDISMMLGSKPGPYWIAMWCFITPVALIFIIIVSAIQYEPSTHNGQVIEDWAEGIGWLMVGVPISLIFIVAAVMVYRMGFKNSMSIQPDWGPALPEDCTGRYAHLFAGDRAEEGKNGDINLPEKNGNAGDGGKVNGGFDDLANINSRM